MLNYFRIIYGDVYFTRFSDHFAKCVTHYPFNDMKLLFLKCEYFLWFRISRKSRRKIYKENTTFDSGKISSLQTFWKRAHYVKSVLIWSYSGPHLPAFGLNTERYGVFLCIQSECGKIRTRITLNKETFYAVAKTNLRL